MCMFYFVLACKVLVAMDNIFFLFNYLDILKYSLKVVIKC